MTRRAALATLLLLAGCAWSNSLYQARLLSGRARDAEQGKRPAEAQQLWGQVIVKAESAYARGPLGPRGAEALWLGGHAAAKIGDCMRAVPKLEGAMTAAPAAPWRQELLLELARCEEPAGGATAVSLYTTLIASSRDSAVVRQARLRLGHALVLREEWQQALDALAGYDTLPARVDRATALIHLGRAELALRELAPAIARADTSVPWRRMIEQMAVIDAPRTDSLIARALEFPTVSAEARSSWLLAGARIILSSDPPVAQHRLQLLLTRPVGASVSEGRFLQAQLRFIRAATPDELRAALARLADGSLPEDGPGINIPKEFGRLARRYLTLNDAVTPGAANGDLAFFVLGELARDSLGARQLAAWSFARVERDWPRSPFVVKALLARADLLPDSADALLARARVRSDDPYVAAASGNVGARVRVMQLEDSLGRYMSRLATARPDRP